MQGTGYPVPGQSSASAGSFQTDPKYLGQLMMNPDPKYLGGLVDPGVQSQMETKYSNQNSGEPESKYHSNPESKYQSSEDKYHQSQEKQQQQQQQYLGQLAAASGSMMCRPVH